MTGLERAKPPSCWPAKPLSGRNRPIIVPNAPVSSHLATCTHFVATPYHQAMACTRLVALQHPFGRIKAPVWSQYTTRLVAIL